MPKDEAIHGLNCPNCGGMVPIPEGHLIVRCPYCDLRSFVRGERGLRRYQTPLRVSRQQASQSLQKFLSSSMAIAGNAARQAQLVEAFVAHLPFWSVWARVAGWAFGEEKVGSGDNVRYKPREIRIVQEMSWNGAACDVGEFGVTQVDLAEAELQPFQPAELHNTGMVFEPVGSLSDAIQMADVQFEQNLQEKARLDRRSQLFWRTLRRRLGMVYHPLWVLRYLYRGRAFQVVLDGYSGKVLYGRAPGNTLYRAAVLVAGMAIGAFLAIDIPAAILYFTEGDDGGLGFAAVVFLFGLGLMFAAYRSFRHGEEYEYRSGPSKLFDLKAPVQMIAQARDVEKWISQFN